MDSGGRQCGYLLYIKIIKMTEMNLTENTGKRNLREFF